MAAAVTLTPSATDLPVGTEITVAGTGWGTDPVTITATHEAVSVDLVPDTNAISGYRITPSRLGKVTITADDGTSTVTKTVTIWSNN